MTASRRSWKVPSLLALASVLVACATPPAGAPPPSAFLRDVRFAAVAPDVADRTDRKSVV